MASLLNFRKLLLETGSIAVVGAKDKAGAPVHDVAGYLLRAGYRLLPVHSVRKQAWGLPVSPDLGSLPEVPDIVCLFRSSANCLQHAHEVLAMPRKPRVFWMQQGIANPEAAHLLEAAGVAVVQDQCIKTVHEQIFGSDSGRVFACRQCGQCCSGAGGIVLSPDDLKRLCAYTASSERDFRGYYCQIRNNKLILITDPYNNCIFFEPNIGCVVHPARPDVCRAWPYFRGNLVDKGSLNMARADCPGISDMVRHPEFSWSGFYYLLANDLLACDPLVHSRALVVRAEDLPTKQGLNLTDDEP